MHLAVGICMAPPSSIVIVSCNLQGREFMDHKLITCKGVTYILKVSDKRKIHRSFF